MSLITVPVPSLLQGVSQQPATLRFPSQADLQENGFPSTVDGLGKRQPLDHIARLTTYNLAEPLAHFINRDTTERYCVILDHQLVRVFDTAGVEYPVKGPTNPYTPDFSYLDLTGTTNPVTAPTDFSNVAWSRNGSANTPANVGSPGPLGIGSSYQNIGSAGGAGSDGAYTQSVGSFVQVQTFSLYVRPNAGFPSNGIMLAMKDTSHAVDHAVTFTQSAGPTLAIGASTGGAVGTLERSQNGWWRLSVTVNIGSGTGATTIGSNRQLRIENVGFGGSAQIFGAWGARVDAAATAADYVLRASENFKALSIADFTFVVNKNKTTAVTGATSSTDPSLLKGYVYVRAGNYRTNYAVTVQKQGGSAKTTLTRTWDGTTLNPTPGGEAELGAPAPYPTSTVGTIKTDDIAQDIVDQINSANPAANGQNYSGNTIAADGWTASRVGSVVKIARTDSTVISKLQVNDSKSETNLVAIWKHVPSIDSLPLICEDGFTIKVDGDTTSVLDDYYVKFTADVSSAFGHGKWSETLGFGLNTTLDNTTMPWQLVRKFDDGIGTVTGTPNQKYFEWGPVAWNTRVVGDDTTAPVPSFVGQNITDIQFFANRLTLLTNKNAILSESSRYFNFFRTTVLTLVDSDPIDIAVPSKSVAILNHAVPFNEKLLLVSDQTVFVLTGDPILTPKTVTVRSVLDYTSQRNASPVPTARGVFFADKRGDFSGIRRILVEAQSDTLYSDDATAAIPAYISGDIIQMAASTHEDLFMALSKNDRRSIFVYKANFTEQGQQLQSAWSKYPMDADSKVIGLGFIDTVLYLFIQRPDGVCLESSTIVSGRTDPNATYITYLDRRLQAGPDTTLPGVFSGGVTTWTLPYTPSTAVTMQVVGRVTPTNPTGGNIATLTVAGSAVSVTGDYSGVPVWIGSQYTLRYRFSAPSLKINNSQQNSVAILSGKYQLKRGRLAYAKSSYFRVEITPLYKALYTSQLPVPTVTPTTLLSDTFIFGILSRADQTTIDIVNDSPMPSNFESAEWEAEYVTRGTLFRA